MVVKVNPVTDQAARVLQGFEAVAMLALLLERADHPLDQAGSAGPTLFSAHGIGLRRHQPHNHGLSLPQ